MIRLTSGKIAVDPLFESRMSPETGLLYMPEEAMKKCTQGIVRYMGNDVSDINIGDHVLFSGYSGTTVRLEGEGLLIILHSDFIECVIESADNEVPGLFFRDVEGEYWPATREMATTIIAKSLEPL